MAQDVVGRFMPLRPTLRLLAHSQTIRRYAFCLSEVIGLGRGGYAIWHASLRVAFSFTKGVTEKVAVIRAGTYSLAVARSCEKTIHFLQVGKIFFFL